MKIKLNDLMQQSGVKFGTSGARGLAAGGTEVHGMGREFLMIPDSLGGCTG